jgi:hypothetical protein
MIREHAILSLSGAHIWLKCAPSARFQEQIPGTDNKFSEEGTLAHEVGALMLRYFIGQLTQDQFLNAYNALYLQVYNFYVVNEPLELNPKGLADIMFSHSEDYARFVFGLGGTIFVEEPLDLARFIPLSWGTSDGLNLHHDVLYVNDYKFGFDKVYAYDNPQLMGYALGAYLRVVELGYDPHTIVMNIIQPRVSSEPSSAQISVTHLLEWAATTVAPQAALAIAGQGAFVPGDHCKYCRARTICAAFYSKFGEAWGIQDARVITDDQRAFILQYGDVLVKFIDAIKKDAIKRMRNREVVPGFKLIATQGDRKFTDQVAVATKLWELGFTAEDIYDPASLKGITALEALFKPKKRFTEVLGDYITRPEGNPKLVPADSAGTAIATAAADLYDAEDKTQL